MCICVHMCVICFLASMVLDALVGVYTAIGQFDVSKCLSVCFKKVPNLMRLLFALAQYNHATL